MAKHLLWEWQARQAIRVLNGQRNYDFFSLQWELPLWEIEYLEFWQKLPIRHRISRNLFIDWVKQEDFYGLFRNYSPFISRWPGKFVIIQHVGRGLTFLFGRRISNHFYRALDYFSHYSYLYIGTKYWSYLLRHRRYIGVYSFLSMKWLKKNLPDSTVKKLSDTDNTES